MSANSQVLRTRGPVRLPAWVVIGVGLLIAGTLAVVSVSERDTVTRPPSDTTTIADEGSAGASSYAEMAALKAALAQRIWDERLGVATASTGAGASTEAFARKRGTAQQFVARERGRMTVPTFSYTDNDAPVTIDGELCGQCR